MQKVYRRLLLFISMVTFFAVAPIVILYAVGYRASLSTARAVDPLPVGVLAVETQPRRATIFVSDQEVGNSSRVVTNLPPGTSKVKVLLDGYRAWEKNVQIEPGRASEFRNIVLIPEKISSSPVTQNARLFALSPNHRLTAVVHNNRQLLILDQAGQPVLPDMVIPSMVSTLVWSPDNSALLINGTLGAHYVLTIAQGRTPVSLTALNGARDITWDPRLSGRLLYLDATNSLRVLNVSTKTSVTLLEGIKTFVISPNAIFAVLMDGTVGSYTLSGNQIKYPLTVPGTSKVKNLLVSDNNDLAYLMQDKSLWILSEDGGTQRISDIAAQAIWSAGGQLLLIQADAHSMYVYNNADERNPIPLHEMKLIARLSRPLSNPQWFSDGIHILYQVEDEIWFSETDPRDHAVAYQIDTTNSGSAGVAVGEKGMNIMYIQRVGGQNSLVTTSLIAK